MTRAAACLLIVATNAGCMIGTWRMHPGANMARVESRCVSDPIRHSDGTWTCAATTERVDEPTPVTWHVGVLAGRELSSIGSGDTPELSIEADAGMSYVIPGDRFAVGLEAVYLRDLMNSPTANKLDAVKGWGGNLIAQYAVSTRFVVHAGAGALSASYVLNQGESNEVDSGAFGLRAIAGATYILARGETRDFFFTVQGSYLHLPDEMLGGRDLSYGNFTIAGALGLGLQP